MNVYRITARVDYWTWNWELEHFVIYFAYCINSNERNSSLLQMFFTLLLSVNLMQIHCTLSIRIIP